MSLEILHGLLIESFQKLLKPLILASVTNIPSQKQKHKNPWLHNENKQKG